NHNGRSGNREAREILPAVDGGFSFVIRRRGVEAGETQRTAREINQRDDPAGGSKFLKHNPVNQKRGCDAERNDVGQRIKFATEGAFVPSQTRQPPFLSSSPASAQATIRRATAPVSCLTTSVARGFSNAHVIASFFSEQ